MGNPGKSGEIPDLGSWGVWGAISIVDFKKRVARKLHRIILLHLGLVTFRFHFGKPEQSLFDFGGFLDVSMIPQTNCS